MNDLVLILPQKKQSVFSPKVEAEYGENFIRLYVKDTPAAIKKAAKIIGERKAVVSTDALNMKSLKGHLKKYNQESSNILFSIIKSAVEQVAKEKEITLPFYEICVFADAHTAVKIIERIKSLSKIFTIITNEEFGNEILDELYFKYGVIIRHLTKLNCHNKENTLIISTDSEDPISHWESIPVISMAESCASKNALMLKNSHIKECTDCFVKEWNGKPTMAVYSLLNIEPDKEISVNIREKGDEIFMLDIT